MNKKIMLILVFAVILAGSVFAIRRNETAITPNMPNTDQADMQNDDPAATDAPSNLAIETLRKGSYPGSDIDLVEELSRGSNYKRYRVSYSSEGLKIFALLTIPTAEKPEGGFPAIIFNHGYIPPTQYRTTERYVAYMDAFSRAGYVVFKPDYRGHGDSEGAPSGAYGSNAYTIDVLNAAASVKKHADVNPDKIGMWGHSMGGFITLRTMVSSPDVKAGVIWAGVVGSYPDLLNNWRRRTSVTPSVSATGLPGARRWRDMLVSVHGSPESNPEFWNSISANSFLSDISGPVQLHHGSADASVPVSFSQTLETQMKEAGKTVELFTYPGDDHNISRNLSAALQRSVRFFDAYLK